MSNKILLVLDKMVRAGTQRHILHLLKGLSDRWEFHVVCLEGRGPWDSEIESRGGYFHNYALHRIYDGSAYQTICGLKSLIKELQPIGMETFMFTAHVMGSLAVAKTGSLPIISSRREKILWRKPLHRHLRKMANRQVAHHIVNSEAVKEDIVSLENIDPSKISKINNALDWDDYEKCQNIDLDKTKINILVLAALKKVKQHELVIEAVQLNPQNFENTLFHFVGGGPREQILHRKICEAKLEKFFKFHGFVDPVAPSLSSFDFSVLPSLSEGLSNSLIECQGAGLPVVALDVDGNKEIVENGKSGILVEKGNISDLSKAMLTLIGDSELRKEMGLIACQEAKKRYSVDKMCSLKAAIYEKVFQC